MRRRRNPYDEELRRLERRAAAGDPTAVAAHARAAVRVLERRVLETGFESAARELFEALAKADTETMVERGSAIVRELARDGDGIAQETAVKLAGWLLSNYMYVRERDASDPRHPLQRALRAARLAEYQSWAKINARPSQIECQRCGILSYRKPLTEYPTAWWDLSTGEHFTRVCSSCDRVRQEQRRYNELKKTPPTCTVCRARAKRVRGGWLYSPCSRCEPPRAYMPPVFPPKRKNPDEDRRRAERRAAAFGDEESQIRAAFEQERRDGEVARLVQRFKQLRNMPVDVIESALWVVVSKHPDAVKLWAEHAYAMIGEHYKKYPTSKVNDACSLLVFEPPLLFTGGPNAGERGVPVKMTEMSWHGTPYFPHEFALRQPLEPFVVFLGHVPWGHGESFMIPESIIRRWHLLRLGGWNGGEPR